MSDLLGPDLDLQQALYAALKNDVGVTALVPASRILQHVQDDVKYPYVVFGESQDVPDLADCIDGSELFIDIHVWSTKPAMTECKTIVAALWVAIRDAEIELDQNRLVLIERSGSRTFPDQDGITKHGVLTIRALTEPA